MFLVLCITGGAAPPSDLVREMIEAHGAVRSRVGLPPLAWSNRLTALAQDWANTLLARRKISHRENSQYGENIFAISGAAASPAQVVNSWAAESRNYDYRSNKCRGVCGHYTQIVGAIRKKWGERWREGRPGGLGL